MLKLITIHNARSVTMNTAIIDCRTSEEELYSLKKLNFSPLLCPISQDLYPAVSGHPDMQICIINKHNIVVNNSIEINFTNRLSKLNKIIHRTAKSLNSKYPQDIILNALILGDIFVHRLDSTDLKLLELTKEMKKINVNQGYTKCSAAIVNDKAIITSDKSIIESLKDSDIDILYVPPGDIELPGLDYGFIGGTCGLLNEKSMAFFGDLNFYNHGKDVIDFLKKHGVTPVYLKNGKLTDRGTLFVV
jgi:hypothetical protein